MLAVVRISLPQPLLGILVRNIDRDAATIIMVGSSLQRKSILPSERAKTYKMKLAVIRRKAGRPAKAKKKICRDLRRSSVRTMNKAAPEWEPPCWQRVQFSFRTQRSRERRMLPSSSSPRSAMKGARSSVMPSRSHWLVSPSRAAA